LYNTSSLFDIGTEIVVLTGVSGQIGVEYAKALLVNGAKVAGLDLHTSEMSDKLLEKYPDKYIFYTVDITNKESLEASLKKIQNDFGNPSVLINNAALDSPPSADAMENGPFETYPESSWDKVLDVNLKGTFLCCQVFGAAMAKSQKGSIINVASIYGVVSPDQNLYEYRRKNGEVFFKPVAYSASKSGVINLTKYLAVYWSKHNVRVNSLTIAGVFNNQDKEFLNSYCERIPIGRMANSDEYNGAIIFLSSKASNYMTGHNLVIDGGWTSI
jgi:NAD(P)-dependent dehydrogenase (short-subunit alcohol dehydrogenase family)